MRKTLWNSPIAICCNFHPMFNGFTQTSIMPWDLTVPNISLAALSDTSKIIYSKWYQSRHIFARCGWGLSNMKGEFWEWIHWNLRDTWNLIETTFFSKQSFSHKIHEPPLKSVKWLVIDWALQMCPNMTRSISYDILYNIDFKLVRDIP